MYLCSFRWLSCGSLHWGLNTTQLYCQGLMLLQRTFVIYCCVEVHCIYVQYTTQLCCQGSVVLHQKCYIVSSTSTQTFTNYIRPNLLRGWHFIFAQCVQRFGQLSLFCSACFFDLFTAVRSLNAFRFIWTIMPGVSYSIILHSFNCSHAPFLTSVTGWTGWPWMRCLNCLTLDERCSFFWSLDSCNLSLCSFRSRHPGWHGCLCRRSTPADATTTSS